VIDDDRRPIQSERARSLRAAPLSGLIVGALAAATLSVIGWTWGELLFWRVEPDSAAPGPRGAQSMAGAGAVLAPEPGPNAGPETPRPSTGAAGSPGGVIAAIAENAPVVNASLRATGAAHAPSSQVQEPGTAVDAFGDEGPTVVVIPSGAPTAMPTPAPTTTTAPPPRASSVARSSAMDLPVARGDESPPLRDR
jgi:hypothetical protein